MSLQTNEEIIIALGLAAVIVLSYCGGYSQSEKDQKRKAEQTELEELRELTKEHQHEPQYIFELNKCTGIDKCEAVK